MDINDTVRVYSVKREDVDGKRKFYGIVYVKLDDGSWLRVAQLSAPSYPGLIKRAKEYANNTNVVLN